MDKLPKIAIFSVIIFTFCNFNLFSFQDKTDSITISNTDTLGVCKPNKLLGTFPSYVQKIKIDKNDLVKGDFLSAFELVEKATFHQFLDFGALGLSPLVNEYGFIAFPQILQNSGSNSILPYNYASFELYPLLAVDCIEVFYGSTAEILDKQSNGILYNIKTRQFNSQIPYTQLYISQAGYEYLGSSGVFSQNIVKNLNFFFLYHRYWSAGRYENSNSDRWNLVVGINWFPNSRFNLYFQNKYSILNNALFGGLNPKKSTILFDNTFSVVNFENLNRKTNQNDISLGYLYYLTGDSSFYVDGSLLFSYAKNQFEFENYFAESFNISKSSHYKSNSLTYTTKVNYESKGYKILIGMDFEKRNQNKWLFVEERKSIEPTAYSIFNLGLSSSLCFQFGARISIMDNETNYAYGSNLSFKIDSTTKIYFDLTFDKKGKRSLFEHSQLAIIGFSLSDKNFELSADVFGRNLVNYKEMIIAQDTMGNILQIVPSDKQYDLNIFGSNLIMSLKISGQLTFITKANLNYFISGGVKKEWLPLLDWKNSVSYRFSRGQSYLDLGLEFEIFSPFSGLYYHPLQPYPVENRTRRGWQNNGINAFASAKLGNAFVNVSVRNIISTNYYLLPIYPDYDRNIRITVFWSFNE
ncbi:MAG: hypothetical protein ACPLRO_02285 [Candidatus Kapaibacteriota bacterium]